FVKKINGWDVIASPNFRPKCFLNTTNHCEVYHNRPNACRTYPDWDNIWDSDEHIVKETQSCKGLKLAVQKFKNQNSIC
ncbi:MAG: YkgJ family cysteine cluster protein, partial [Candidatus Margulisiibacteriota bacterium]